MTPPTPHVHKDWKKMFWNGNKKLFLGGAITDYYFLIQYVLFCLHCACSTFIIKKIKIIF